VDLARGHERREDVRAFEERASALAAGAEELDRSIRESQAAVGWEGISYDVKAIYARFYAHG
jgi:hypothetical protein